jgi:hypothetical protein
MIAKFVKLAQWKGSDLLLRSLALKTLNVFPSLPHCSPCLEECPVSISLCRLGTNDPLSGSDNRGVLSVAGEEVAAGTRVYGRCRATASKECPAVARLLNNFTLGRDDRARFNRCGFAVAEERHGVVFVRLLLVKRRVGSGRAALVVLDTRKYLAFELK